MHVKHTDDAVGPRAAQASRHKQLLTELHMLNLERKTLESWCVANVADPKWSDQYRALNILVGRISILKQRIQNVETYQPELGLPDSEHRPIRSQNQHPPQL